MLRSVSFCNSDLTAEGHKLCTIGLPISMTPIGKELMLYLLQILLPSSVIRPTTFLSKLVFDTEMPNTPEWMLTAITLSAPNCSCNCSITSCASGQFTQVCPVKSSRSIDLSLFTSSFKMYRSSKLTSSHEVMSIPPIVTMPANKRCPYILFIAFVSLFRSCRYS